MNEEDQGKKNRRRGWHYVEQDSVGGSTEYDGASNGQKDDQETKEMRRHDHKHYENPPPTSPSTPQ